jgi:hypothetical protein
LVTVEIPEESTPASNFAVQVIVGTFLFSLVLLAAFGLAKLVELMEHWGAPAWMIAGSHWVEWVLFWGDVFLFGLFLLSEAFKFLTGLLKEWRA